MLAYSTRYRSFFHIFCALLFFHLDVPAVNPDSLVLLLPGKKGIEKVKTLNELTVGFSVDYPAKAMERKEKKRKNRIPEIV